MVGGNMEILVDGKKTQIKTVKIKTVKELISALGVNSEEVLVKVNGKLTSDGGKISQKDEVKVMRIIFGG